MKNKKKMLIAGASALGCAVIGFGAYAYFFDSDMHDDELVVGTVSLEGDIELKHKDAAGRALNNLNPGDNDPTISTTARDGSDHELEINYENTGNKSVLTRTVITVTGTKADGTPLTKETLARYILLGRNNTQGDVLGNTATAANKQNIVLESVIRQNEQGENVYTVAVDNSNSNVYVIDSGILSGVGRVSEKEKDSNGNEYASSGSLRLDLGLDYDAGIDLMGAEISFNVQVQAIQYRNTNDAQWDALFEETYTTVIG
jgi:hypothetical protein